MNSGSLNKILPVLLAITVAESAFAAKPVITSPLTYTGQVGVALVPYQITATNGPFTGYNAVGLPNGLSVNTTTGIISGTPATGTDALSPYNVTISATNGPGGNGTGSATLVLTILPAPVAFVGFRLPDYPATPTPAPTPASNDMQLWLQMGANGGTTVANRFNATLEVQVPGTTTWVPYNQFVGINDTASWITDAPLPVRTLPGSSPAPSPYPSPPAFSSGQLIQSPPGVYMKADPRSTRFGIFQEDSIKTNNSRIIESLWPKGSPAPPAPTPPPNGYGGTVGITFSPTTVDVEHVPLRFAPGGVGTYYPGTFSINNGVIAAPTPPARYSQATSYADNDGVLRLADAVYADPTYTGNGSSTPYNTTDYRPMMLNRPFRNVGELGYVFRDLPWKTLDLFSQNSADAGLLDVFCINDGPRSTASYDGTNFGTVVPQIVAGRVNLNSQQPSCLQAILASALWDDTSVTVSSTGSPTAQNAQTMAGNIATATSTTAMQNKTELITRTSLPTTILPLAGTTPTPSPNPLDNQTVKARREAVPRAISSVSQTRVWNLLIDVVAQSGHYKPNATNLPNDFMVEGQQHYWVHLAIDRFTGQVIDKQIEVVNE